METQNLSFIYIYKYLIAWYDFSLNFYDFYNYNIFFCNKTQRKLNIDNRPDIFHLHVTSLPSL